MRTNCIPSVPSCLRAFVPLLFLFSSCKSATHSGHNTALSGFDLVQMTDDMAMKIAADPAVQAEFAQHGPLKIVVEPVVNELTAEVLPQGEAEEFTTRVRVLLSKHSPEEFTWIMNRDTYYDLRGKELESTLGPSPDAVNPQYALTATFSSITRETHKGRSEYYLCVYKLTDLQQRTIFWTDKYELKKSAVRGFLD